METNYRSKITAVILAGGESRRMQGSDKGLLQLLGRPLIHYGIERIKPQVSEIIINANRNSQLYSEMGYPVIVDNYSGYEGPLAGISACMARTDTEYLACIPCDSPIFPDDLVERLYKSIINNNADISVVHDGNRTQPTFSLIKISLLGSLLDFLKKGHRKIYKWYANHSLVQSDFSDKEFLFLNINTRDDLNNAEVYMSKYLKF
ncbi:MAG: molybdopterin-guanine dinucleotide biosynthesis protein A [Gammaproteobacteria bacterium]|jgi:molybdopterin-guanine dinucleotide biosynthesis protein A